MNNISVITELLHMKDIMSVIDPSKGDTINYKNLGLIRELLVLSNVKSDEATLIIEESFSLGCKRKSNRVSLGASVVSKYSIYQTEEIKYKKYNELRLYSGHDINLIALLIRLFINNIN